MIDTSLIITLYQGNQYLPYLLQIAEENFKNMRMQMGLDCELILINDEPGNKLPVEEGKKNWGEIVVCNLKENQGIHGARQSGAKLARGRYLVFLDQDDKITGNYLISQRKKIGNCDAVVCNGYRTEYGMDVKWYIYPSTREQENVAIIENYLSEGNLIVSPGQVLFVKEALPEIWIKKTMKVNGADDFLLWVLMLFSGKKFAINEERLYVHIGHERNVSNNIAVMEESIKEVIQIIQECSDFFGIQKEQLEKLEQWRKKKKEMEVERANKLGGIQRIFKDWTYLENQNISVADFLGKQGIARIAIYGLEYIGGRLFNELRDTDVDVVCGIDQMADRMFMEGLPIVKFEDARTVEYMQQVDAIVITASISFQKIKKMIEERYSDIKIFSVEEMIRELLIGLEKREKYMQKER